MTKEQIEEHKKNPNILLKVAGVPFHCPCGCNVFHHVDDDSVYICNSCKTEYEAE